MIENLLISCCEEFRDMPHNNQYTLYKNNGQSDWVKLYYGIHLSYHGVNRLRQELGDNFNYITLGSCLN